jgi:predicted MFS family arabinose efflux permease
VGWTALASVAPYYPLYALFFLSTGLTGAEVSGLFAVWSVTGFLAEVPAGALADRWSRRGSLVLAGLFEAAGFAVWTALPGLPGFAAGFVLWGLGGALASGAAEALVYDGLAAAGAAAAYPRVNGWISATELAVQLPTAGLATGLFAAGGYPLVGWVSVAACLLAAGAALRLPEPPRSPDAEYEGSLKDPPAPHHSQARGGPLQEGRLAVALRDGGVLLLLLALAVLGGLDAIEEYFPVMAGAWGVPAGAVPLAVLAIPLTGAAGAALAGRAGRWSVRGPAALLAVAAVLLGVAALWARPAALAAVAVFYGLYLAVLVVAEARLQDRITGRYRATLTSVSALGVELMSLAVFAAWAVGGALAIAVLTLAAVPVLVAALRGQPAG